MSDTIIHRIIISYDESSKEVRDFVVYLKSDKRTNEMKVYYEEARKSKDYKVYLSDKFGNEFTLICEN